LPVRDGHLTEETEATILRGCAAAHYHSANMDELVFQYHGNINEFLPFLSEMWHWKIVYDKESQIITADENKSVCVCPLVQKNKGRVSTSLCHCSEGFAERMFSAVTGRNVQAKVIRSILRGDKSCIYTIQIL
jgi:predicted hydrocarbon binding protein